MNPDTISRYVESISRTKKGLKVLIADDIVVEQLMFLEMVKHYLPESNAKAVGQFGLESELNDSSHIYDLVVLEERLMIEMRDQRYVQRIRTKYPKAKIALFIDRKNLYQLQTVSRSAAIDLMLTKCLTVEAIAEKLCLSFPESE